MAPRIINFVEWRAHTIIVLRQQIETRPDPVIQALLTEVMNYPAPTSGVALATGEGPQRYATPLQIAHSSWDSLVPQYDHGLRHAD